MIGHGVTGHGVPVSRRPLVVLAAAFLAFAAYGSLVPFDIQRVTFHEAVARFAATPWVPLAHASKTDLLTNVLLYVPIGFFVLGTLAADSRRLALLGWPLVVCAALVFAASIEFGQIFVSGRTASWNDVAAQTAGAAAGGALWILMGSLVADWFRTARRSPSSADRLFRVLGVYVALWLVLGLLPFDYTVRPQELAEKFRAGRIVLQPFGPATTVADVVGTFIMAVPVGVFAYLWARQTHPGQAPLVGIVAGAAATAVVESAQLLAMSRTADVTDVVVSVAGTSLGVWLSLEVERQPTADHARGVRIWPLAALLGWVVLLAARHWSPFDFVADGAFARTRLELMFRMPFHSYYWGTPLNAFAEAATKFLLGMPVGALLQWMWQPSSVAARRLHVIGIALLAFLLFLGVELGQVFVPSRVPDQTDVYIAVVGALTGAYLSRLLSASSR
jgi:VanZ family protein